MTRAPASPTRHGEARLERVVLASGNAGKLREFDALLRPLGVSLVAQSTLGIEPAEEPHPTFLENALEKARHASRRSGLPAMADDSGICVPALGGRPGVHSARFAALDGQGEGDAANNAWLIESLRSLPGVPDPCPPAGLADAYYYCVLVLVRAHDDPQPIVADASWHGRVVPEARGDGGFGYDPYFLVPDTGCTAAELSAAQKNALSHRGHAAAALLAKLRDAGLT
ncbi:MAG: non-canonical purine NTP pyrophosphatase [Burkholderiaceae bacterium]|nr:non-canonical purine NTP pyrophosphatase [Burkholderiaceae bacterium]